VLTMPTTEPTSDSMPQGVFIRVALTRSELLRCFPVVLELRPHLHSSEFLQQVERQEQRYGYQLAYLEDEEDVRAIAGFRLTESLAWGKYLYVDDLVTRAIDRSKGYGDRLFDWLLEQGRSHQCRQLHLDSGVQRFGAHRFYMNHRLEISSHHFSMPID
jgi:GNAT superfamily N-acetyltransferase